MLERDNYLFQIFHDAWDSVLGGKRQIILVDSKDPGSYSLFIDELLESLGKNRVTRNFREKLYPEEYRPPYFPFLEFSKKHFAGMDVLDVGDHLNKYGIYTYHVELFAHYLLFGTVKRDEEVIPFDGEVDFEKSKVLDSISRIYGKMSEASPFIVIIDNLQFSSKSTREYILHLMKSKEKSKILFIFSFNKDYIWADQENNTDWKEFVEGIEDEYPLIHFEGEPEEEVSGPAEDQPARSERRSVQRMIQLSRNCLSFFALEEARHTITSTFRRIKEDNIHLSEEDRFQLFHTLGDVYTLCEEPDSAVMYYNLLFNFLQEKDSSQQMYDVYRKLSIASIKGGRIEKAREYARQAWDLDWQNSDKLLVAKVYLLYLFFNNTDLIYENLSVMNRLIEILQDLELDNYLSTVYTNSSYLSAIFRTDEPEIAFEKCFEGIRIAQKSGNLYRMSIAYHSLGLLYQQEEDYENAFQAYKECEKLRLRLGDKLEIIKICNGIGYFCFSIEDYKNAEVYYHKALGLLDGLSDYQEIGITLYNIALVHFFIRDYKNALKYLEDILYLMDELGLEELPFHTKSHLYPVAGISYIQTGQFYKAIEYVNKSRMGGSAQDKTYQFYIEVLDALILKTDKEYDEALEHLKRAQSYLGSGSLGTLQPYLLYETGIVYTDKNDKETADKIFWQGLEYCGEFRYPFHRLLLVEAMGIGVAEKRPHLHPRNFNVEYLVKSVKQQQNLYQLHKKIDEMDFLNNLQNILARSKGRESLIEGVMGLISNSFMAEMSFLFLNHLTDLHCVFASLPLEELDFDIKNLAAELLRQKKEVLIPRVRDDEFYNRLAPSINSLVCLPMMSGNETIGGLLFASRRREKYFTQDDLSTLSIVSKQLGISLERIDLMEKQKAQLNYIHIANQELARKNGQFIRELEMARRVQESMIASSFSSTIPENFEIGSKCLFMESVGGDLLDVMDLGDNRYGFLIADVSGHGVPAAMITAMAKMAFNSYSRGAKDPGSICASVNEELFQLLGDSDYYVAAYFGILDMKKGTFEYSNAGHYSAILYRRATDNTVALDVEGFVIGFMQDLNYETKTVQLHKGDRIIYATDGIIEARNREGKFYEYDRFINFILKESALSPQKFVDKLYEDVNIFCDGAPAMDDRAVLCIEFKGKIPEKQG